jgi:hypothetical protein
MHYCGYGLFLTVVVSQVDFVKIYFCVWQGRFALIVLYSEIANGDAAMNGRSS